MTFQEKAFFTLYTNKYYNVSKIFREKIHICKLHHFSAKAESFGQEDSFPKNNIVWYVQNTE